MKYIEIVDKEGCFLCDSSKDDTKKDRENLVLFRGRESFVIMNRYPYNSCHLMVAPYKHTPEILELSDDCRNEMMELTGKSMQILKERVASQGFNCGINVGRIAGAGLVDHVHMHIVPRWAGDVNFMPVFGEVKSIPEYLLDTFDRLAGDFSGICS